VTCEFCQSIVEVFGGIRLTCCELPSKPTVDGWAGGVPTDSQATLHFAEMTGVRPMIERYPLAKAAAGYGRMMSGKAEFRVVLTP